MNIGEVMEYAEEKVLKKKGDTMKPDLLLIHDLKRGVWDKLEKIYDINPQAKLDVFYDFRFTECSCKYFVRANAGSK